MTLSKLFQIQHQLTFDIIHEHTYYVVLQTQNDLIQNTSHSRASFFLFSSASFHHIDKYDISAQINLRFLSTASASTTLSRICRVCCV